MYFDEITRIASEASLLQGAMTGANFSMNGSVWEKLKEQNGEKQLRSLFATFQTIQRQCWKLESEIEGERNAFRALIEKICVHFLSGDNSLGQHSEALAFFEEQIAGLDSLTKAVKSLSDPISQVVNALFFTNKLLDLVESSSEGEILGGSTPLSMLETISNNANLCLDDINRLVTNIQIHDMVRQRFEHIDKVYELLLCELTSAKDKNFKPEYLPVVSELATLHLAQLEFTKEECMGTFSAIRNALNTIDERMSDALVLFVKVSCLNKHSEIGFDKDIEHLLKDSFALISGNEQKYIVAVGDLQASFRELKVKQLRLRGSLVDYLNCSAVLDETAKSMHVFYDELQDMAIVLRNVLLKLNVKVTNSIPQFADIAKRLEFIDGTSSKSHEAFYNRLAYRLYEKKCSLNGRMSGFPGAFDDDDLGEAHGKYTEFFGRKISEVIDDLAKLSRQPRLVNASKEHIRRGFNKIEKVYTMQCEREIHRKIYSGIVGNDFEGDSSAMAECAADDDNLELF